MGGRGSTGTQPSIAGIDRYPRRSREQSLVARIRRLGRRGDLSRVVSSVAWDARHSLAEATPAAVLNQSWTSATATDPGLHPIQLDSIVSGAKFRKTREAAHGHAPNSQQPHG